MKMVPVRDRLLWITLAVQKRMLWIALGVLVVVVVYRIGFHIPVPAIDEESLRQIMPR